MAPNPSLTEPLNRWSSQNAMLMITVIAGALLLRAEALPLAAVLAGGSFGRLILRFRGLWTPGGRFGPANGITLLRLLAALVLLLWSEGRGLWPAGLALSILGADGLDGWAARRWGTVSEFGHWFDQEVDAFFFLALCLILYTHDRLGPWGLLPGSLRYLFVLFSGMAPSPRPTVRGNRYTRAMGVIAVLAFTVCLLPVGAACSWLAAGAALGLCASFLYSAWRIYRPAAED